MLPSSKAIWNSRIPKRLFWPQQLVEELSKPSKALEPMG
jgi:hypothetical protein